MTLHCLDIDACTGGSTLLTMTEVYPSKEALEAGAGAAEATHETFAQLDDLLAELIG